MLKQLPTVERRLESVLSDMAARWRYVVDRFPCEGKLAEQFGVSRNTVREAVIQLESEGMLARCHGVGTILRRAPGTHVRSVALPEVIRSIGKTPGVEQISVAEGVHAPDIARRFRLPDAAKLLRLERVLTADGQPVAYVVDHMSPAQFADWDVDWDTFDGNLISKIADHTRSEKFLQNASLSATLSDADVAARLKCDVGLPLIEISTDLFSEKVELLAVTRLLIVPGTLPLGFAGTIHATKLS